MKKEKTLYDKLQEEMDNGCESCPYLEECDQGAGYTMMDEFGECPRGDNN